MGHTTKVIVGMYNSSFRYRSTNRLLFWLLAFRERGREGEKGNKKKKTFFKTIFFNESSDVIFILTGNK